METFEMTILLLAFGPAFFLDSLEKGKKRNVGIMALIIIMVSSAIASGMYDSNSLQSIVHGFLAVYLFAEFIIWLLM